VGYEGYDKVRGGTRGMRGTRGTKGYVGYEGYEGVTRGRGVRGVRGGVWGTHRYAMLVRSEKVETPPGSA